MKRRGKTRLMSLNISLNHSDCLGLRQSHKHGQKRNLTRRQRKQVSGGLWLETAQSTGLWSPEFKSFLVLIVWSWERSFFLWVSGFPLVDPDASSFYCAPTHCPHGYGLSYSGVRMCCGNC